MRHRISVVVDDEPVVRAYMSAVLRQENYQTVEAGGGTDALEILHNLEGCVDLVVTDVQMPDGDGLSLAAVVTKSYPAVPIILVSGREKPPTELAFLQKPFGPAALVDAVRQVTSAPRKLSSRAGNGQ